MARRLLTSIHYPVFGGPHNGAMHLAPVLERHGVATTVLLPNVPGNPAARAAGYTWNLFTAGFAHVYETVEGQPQGRAGDAAKRQAGEADQT